MNGIAQAQVFAMSASEWRNDMIGQTIYALNLRDTKSAMEGSRRSAARGSPAGGGGGGAASRYGASPSSALRLRDASSAASALRRSSI